MPASRPQSSPLSNSSRRPYRFNLGVGDGCMVPITTTQPVGDINVPKFGTNRLTGGLIRLVAFEWSKLMRTQIGSPSIVPTDDIQTVYTVLDDFGAPGRAYRETDADRADLETVIMGMLGGQFHNPIQVVGFNTSDGWSQDVSADVAQEIRLRCDLQGRDVPFYLEAFIERYKGRYRDVQLPLPMRMF